RSSDLAAGPRQGYLSARQGLTIRDSPAGPRSGFQSKNYRANHMVKIRLTRGGAKKRPFYHVVVTDSRNKRDGRALERLGYYNPVAQGNEKRVEINTERVKHWVSHGAQLTDKVAALVKEASAQASA